MEEQHGTAETRPPLDGSGQHITETTEVVKESLSKMSFKLVPSQTGGHTHLSFAEPRPPKVPLKTTNTRAAQAEARKTPMQNRSDTLAEQGSRSDDRDSERLNFGSLSGAYSGASSAKNSTAKEPISLTPEILNMLDKLDPDKGKQARLLTEHLKGRRIITSTEQEL